MAPKPRKKNKRTKVNTEMAQIFDFWSKTRIINLHQVFILNVCIRLQFFNLKFNADEELMLVCTVFCNQILFSYDMFHLSLLIGSRLISSLAKINFLVLALVITFSCSQAD